MKAVWLGLVVAGALAGCAGSSHSKTPPAPSSEAPGERTARPADSTTPGDDAPDVAAMAAWRARLAKAKCEREQRCGPVWPSEDDCLEDADAWPAYVRFFAGLDEDAYLASTHTLAGAGVLDACVAAAAGAACDDARSEYEACLGVLLPKAPRGAGEPCAYDSPYVTAPGCAPGLVCTLPYGCGTCEPLAPAQNEGGACEFSQDCAAGLVCVAGACRAYATLPGEGETCDQTGMCRDGLACLTNSLRCVRASGEGEPCDVNADSCLRNLTCELDATGSATCHAYARRGASCPRAPRTSAGSEDCNRSNWCVFATPDAATGACELASLSAGPCPLFADDGSYYCPAGTYVDPAAEDSPDLAPQCTCKPGLELGAPCQTDAQCVRGYCGGNDATKPRCVPLLADGEACTPSANHCASYDCDPSSGICRSLCE